MKQIWAPWRMEYILSDKDTGCFLCEAAGQKPGEGNLMLYKTDYSMVVMNRYPYNNGHIMVAPIAHTPDLAELTSHEFGETMELFRFTVKALEMNLSPEGINAGLNLGKSAGAGLEEHLHWHIVPRWHGDTNFMPVISDTRVVPEAIVETYRGLKPLFDGYSEWRGKIE